MEYFVAGILLIIVMVPLIIIFGVITLVMIYGLWPLVILGWGMGLQGSGHAAGTPLVILGVIASLIWYSLMFKWWGES